MRACGQRHFYGPLPVGSLQASKSDRLLGFVEESARLCAFLRGYGAIGRSSAALSAVAASTASFVHTVNAALLAPVAP